MSDGYLPSGKAARPVFDSFVFFCFRFYFQFDFRLCLFGNALRILAGRNRSLDRRSSLRNFLLCQRQQEGSSTIREGAGPRLQCFFFLFILFYFFLRRYVGNRFRQPVTIRAVHNRVWVEVHRRIQNRVHFHRTRSNMRKACRRTL